MVLSIPIKYKKFSNRSIWTTDEALTGTITPGQSGPVSDCNEGVFHIPQFQMQFSGMIFVHAFT